MTVDAQSSLRLPGLSRRNALAVTRGLAVGLALIVSACSGSSHSTSLGGTGAGSTTGAATYTIGGAMAGLSGTGLVLTNGATTLSIASGATSFVFPNAVASGTAYTVMVQTSPAGLTCSVAGGSGTVQTANVNSIIVTCAAVPYTIGGAVSGLTATGLTLTDGTDTLSVASGATSYTLPTPVAPTSSYNVVVQAEPNGGPYCSVANGSGTMPARNVTNVNVSCSTQPFTVGGSISGLNGSGLVLANGGSTVTVAANAASFAIPSVFGSTYDILVQTQPAGITCAVSAGSGTMPANNVTSVVVTCSDQTYSLSGTVSGLTTSGLVLANGSSTTMVASGASTYSLPVPYGSPYSVTVQTQPTGLTCSVANPIGTMPPNNQNGVNVTCAPNSYTLGGSITNPHGTGLVLANGTDMLTVQSNAPSFTMPNSVAYGASYTITVQTQPRGYNCVVSSGGPTTMGAGDVTSVMITCTQHAVWAYSPDYVNQQVLLYSVDNSSHALTLSSNTYPTSGTTPFFAAVNATSTVLYVVNRGANSVDWFSIDATTGALTNRNTITTGVGTVGFTPQMIVFNPAGTLAFVPDQGNDLISVYSVAADGSLTAVTGSPFSVVTANHSASGPQYAGPTSIAVHPTLPQIYVTNTTSGEVATFSYSTGGVLTQGVSIGNYQGVAFAAPQGIVLDPTGAYAYVAGEYYYGGSVIELGIDSSGGVLTALGYVITTGAQPLGISIDPTGQFVYTANNYTAANATTTPDGITSFQINPQTHLVSVTGSEQTAAYPSTVLADPVTGLVYVVNNGSPTESVDAFNASGTTGVLTTQGTANGPSGANQNSIVFANP